MTQPDFSTSPVRYGVDKEAYQKMKSKFDPQQQQEAISWIEAVTGETVGDFYTGLKNGVILCKLINCIRPGTISSFSQNPKNNLVERENIQAYLNGCIAVGVPSHELFTISDLHERKLLPSVLINIFALGRIAQVVPTFSGPRLGPKYTQTAEDIAKRRQTREMEAYREWEHAKERESQQISRRDTLEAAKIEDAKRKLSVDTDRASQRRLTREKLELPSWLAQQKQPEENLEISTSPVRYGMDLEIQNKMKAKYDVEAEELVMDWIEQVTGEPVDYFHQSLKSGILLCKIINKIRPGTIPKINTKPGALYERENIQFYLNSAAQFGVPRFQLFVASDLYEKKDLGAVVTSVTALAKLAPNINPNLPVFGTKLAEVKPPEETRPTLKPTPTPHPKNTSQQLNSPKVPPTTTLSPKTASPATPKAIPKVPSTASPKVAPASPKVAPASPKVAPASPKTATPSPAKNSPLRTKLEQEQEQEQENVEAEITETTPLKPGVPEQQPQKQPPPPQKQQTPPPESCCSKCTIL